MDNITFYKAWLPLDKKEFRILAMLADQGEFSGNLSDLCRYFSLSPQTSNRTQLRTSIDLLTRAGFIQCDHRGRRYTLKAVPKEEEIEIPREWFLTLLHHDYTSESVAWEQVLKVWLWIAANDLPVITNALIAADLSISTSTIGCAKNVLQKEYNAIIRKQVSEKCGDSFRTIGQELAATAWWNIE